MAVIMKQSYGSHNHITSFKHRRDSYTQVKLDKRINDEPLNKLSNILTNEPQKYSNKSFGSRGPHTKTSTNNR